MMNVRCLGGLAALAGLMALMFGPAGCKTKPPEEPAIPVEPTGPHAELLKLFPRATEVADWKPTGHVALYGPEARAEDAVKPLTDDIGQEALLFHGYEYVKSATLSYTRADPGEKVTLRIFVMGSPAEAFGIFSVRARGTQFPVVGSATLAARMTPKTLAFVKDRYYIQIDYSGPRDATPVLMEFGNNVADRIASRGYPPAILQNFPPGSVPGENYYLHAFETLTNLPFFPISDPERLERILGLGPDAEVAIMGYPTKRLGVTNYLFAIKYPTGPDAQSASLQYKAYLDTSTNPAEKNIAIAVAGQVYMVGTLSAEENSIQDRLAELVARLGG
jgi:hypothetical protein